MLPSQPLVSSQSGFFWYNVRLATVLRIALLILELFYTLEKEVDAIWKRKFSAVTFLYAMIRGCTLGYILVINTSIFIPVMITVSLLFKTRLFLTSPKPYL